MAACARIINLQLANRYLGARAVLCCRRKLLASWSFIKVTYRRKWIDNRSRLLCLSSPRHLVSTVSLTNLHDLSAVELHSLISRLHFAIIALILTGSNVNKIQSQPDPSDLNVSLVGYLNRNRPINLKFVRSCISPAPSYSNTISQCQASPRARNGIPRRH